MMEIFMGSSTPSALFDGIRETCLHTRPLHQPRLQLIAQRQSVIDDGDDPVLLDEWREEGD